MNQLRTNRAVKIGAFFLCMVLSCVSFWSSLVTLNNWDDLWSGGNYYDSYSISTPLYKYTVYVVEAMGLYQKQQWQGTLPYSDSERYAKLLALLDPAATNFRYQVHDEAGNLISDNLNDATLSEIAGRIQMKNLQSKDGEDLYSSDYTVSIGDVNYLMAYTGTSFVRCDPAVAVGSFNRYGWRSTGSYWDDYDETFDTRIRQSTLVVEYGVLTPLVVNDSLHAGLEDYVKSQSWLPSVAVLAFVSLCLSGFFMVFLCRSAGHRRGTAELALLWADKIPFDLYLLVDILLIALFINGGDTASYSFRQHANRAAIVGLVLFSLLTALVVFSALRSIAIRVKVGSLVKNTLCYRIWRILREGFSHWNVIWRTVATFLIYLAISTFSLFYGSVGALLLCIPFQVFVLWQLCRWARQWRAVQEGAQHIATGDTEYKIATARMYHDLGEHANQLNELGGGMSLAVEQQLKGERFKAELITNVSHDLKTPLTSIINYVDLLKKADIQNPTALDYIEVLDRKSQRLKKLTEDLVEASKASTGNLTVNKEKLGVCQLVNQALGEYEEKFVRSELTIVSALPEQECYIEADGRHLWRVLDNLLGNCVKYTQPNTRVYLDMNQWDGKVSLALKNISKSPLNIPPDQLMERFVRGDESRNTEGSGLGLSIARSLTELQGGDFRLDIDGDLFKAVVSFPIYREEEGTV